MSENVYIYSVGMTKFGKFLDKSIKKLTGEALTSLKNDFKLGFYNIEAAWFSNSGWGM
jgi:acetyl-CoA acetyltransferase